MLLSHQHREWRIPKNHSKTTQMYQNCNMRSNHHARVSTYGLKECCPFSHPSKLLTRTYQNSREWYPLSKWPCPWYSTPNLFCTFQNRNPGECTGSTTSKNLKGLPNVILSSLDKIWTSWSKQTWQLGRSAYKPCRVSWGPGRKDLMIPDTFFGRNPKGTGILQINSPMIVNQPYDFQARESGS